MGWSMMAFWPGWTSEEGHVWIWLPRKALMEYFLDNNMNSPASLGNIDAHIDVLTPKVNFGILLLHSKPPIRLRTLVADTPIYTRIARLTF